VHGTRIALLVGFVSMGIAAAVGIVIGALAGYFGGWVDMVFSRVIELVLCIPELVLILALLAVVEQPTIWHIMAVIGLTHWTSIARLTRGEFIKLRQMEFVSAARALGASQSRIMFAHILRNALAPVLVPITFGIAAAILIESALSFLGFGAPPPNPSWGTVLSAGRTTIQQTWWLIVFPGAAIFLTVLAYNLIGEGLQEATDPRLRQDSH
jgi:peptide/nickel transport system permease protein